MRILNFFPLLIMVALGSSCYTLREGTALLGLYSQARPVDQVLQDEKTDPQDRKFLQLTQEIRRFAVEHLGLKANANYTTFIKTEKTYLADVVSACESLAFKQYLWDYPFIGRLPYQGFFRPEDALEEVNRLKALGYDVMSRRVEAFSTLGILSDPLFSFMTGASEYRMANLIIHEQTHATIFKSGQGDYNENLATFIGDQGALEYLTWKYGPDSPAIKEALNQKRDNEVFGKKLATLTKNLDNLYQNPLASLETKRQAKPVVIQEFQKDFLDSYEKDFLTKNYRWFGEFKVNNALLMTFRNYLAHQEPFQVLFEQNNRNLRRMIETLKESP